MKPYKHQEEISLQAYSILKQHYLVYLSMEERTGKSLTAILVAEMSKAKSILIITKKKAMIGWEDTISKYKPSKFYTIMNYESLHKLVGNFDLVIIDESHANLSAYPKPTKTWKTVYSFTKNKPLIYLSATPSAQTFAQLYHQLKLSSWCPYKHKNFYDWHRDYGIASQKFIGGRVIKEYHKVKNKAYEDVKHLFISYTRQELGFKHEPNDIIHLIALSEETKVLYNKLMKDNILELPNGEKYIADTPMKLLVGLHQIEGSTILMREEI